MNISEFVENYNLHDSLLEKIEYNAEEKKVRLTVDFCYWQQENFKDGMEETGVLMIEFKDVLKFVYTPYKINSDEIIKVEIKEDCFNITMFSDLLDCYPEISIKAKTVSIIK